MEIDKITKHIEAEIYLCPREIDDSNFGRTQAAPLNNGHFRPQFYYEGKDWDCIIFSDKMESLNIGESGHIYISFLNPEYYSINLKVGQVFLLRNGQCVIAYGKVLQKSIR